MPKSITNRGYIKQQPEKETLMVLPQVYLYGTAYFRPPNPPRQDHAFHLAKIKNELGFDVIRLRMQWNAIHRLPDSFDWEEYDEILNLCAKLGLKAFLETCLECAPYWLERMHPETRYVSANGQAVELGTCESIQFGGHPGLCFHHRPVLDQGRRFLSELALHFRDRSEVIGYDCWNEPHLEPAWICNMWANMGDRLFCYCAETRRAFRSWLARKYETVDSVNRTWGRAYESWEDINPPNRHGTYSDWLDWARFWFDGLREHMQWRYDGLREQDKSRFIMSHSGAVPPFLPRANAFIHNWKLAEPVDVWGTSFAPKYHNWDLGTCAGTMDATRSAARGKPFWISEMSGGATYDGGFKRSPLPRPKDFRAWNWLAATYGAKATIHWCYLEESTGLEAGCFGLIRANGQTTERAREAAIVASSLRKYQHIFWNTQPAAQVGILYDPDNSMQLFAMENSDDLYSQSHIGYYRAVWRADLFARYVTYDSLDDLQGLKVLVVPMCLTLPEYVAKRLQEFVWAGGVLIAEARTGLFDQRGYLQSELPSGGLASVVGAVEEEPIASDPDRRPLLNNPKNDPWPDAINDGPEIAFKEPIEANVRPKFYLVPLAPTTGRPIAECLGHCVAVANEHGQGSAYYFGTYMGLRCFAEDAGALDLVTHLLKRHTAAPVSGDKLRPRLIESGDDALLCVFNNDRSQVCTEQIQLPKQFSSAYDVFRDAETPIVKGTSLEVTVEPEDVAVIFLAGSRDH